VPQQFRIHQIAGERHRALGTAACGLIRGPGHAVDGLADLVGSGGGLRALCENFASRCLRIYGRCTAALIFTRGQSHGRSAPSLHCTWSESCAFPLPVRRFHRFAEPFARYGVTHERHCEPLPLASPCQPRVRHLSARRLVCPRDVNDELYDTADATGRGPAHANSVVDTRPHRPSLRGYCEASSSIDG